MTKSLIGAVVLTALSLSALAQGIRFEKGDWKSVQAKAVREHKLIYMDVYTTWCGPCKIMAQQYFPTEQAGNAYNKNFVCYQIDAEKGEGLDIASKYEVHGYPTNLFLEASTGKVVYRTLGVPSDIDGFLKNAATALQEQKDPMSISEYDKKFKSGKYDIAFLKKYLQKNERLGLDNDAVIDAYLDKTHESPASDSTLLLISKYQSSISNKGYQVLAANSQRLDNLLKTPGYFDEQKNSYYYNAMRKVTEAKDEQAFNTLLGRIGEFEKHDVPGLKHYFLNDFYKKTDQQAKLDAANEEFADYIAGLSQEQIAQQSTEMQASAREQLRWQLEKMNTPKDKIDGLIEQNMKRPDIQYAKELQYAGELNSMAWDAYEKNSKGTASKAQLDKAAVWAQKSMALSEVSVPVWTAVADTYAHILALQGDKGGAKTLEQQVIDKAKAAGIQETGDFENFLKELN